MRVGIAYDLKGDAPVPAGAPDDLHEEFDSPATVEALAGVLRDLGHEIDPLGDGRPFLERVLSRPPDFVFNLAEGEGVGRAREARVPAVLEMLGIPYSGSDPLTLAVTLDKDCAKRLVASAGVDVPRGVVLQPGEDPAEAQQLPYPVIAKPAWEGSSKGIRTKSLVERPPDLPAALAWLWKDHRQPVLVEEFVEGDELTVGIVGNQPPEILGVMRVVPRDQTERFVYSLEIKRDFERLVRYECPAPLAHELTLRVRRSALAAYRALGCRDVARVDFRVRDGVPYFLEVNPLPGLNPQSSDLVIMARLVGKTHAQLVQAIFEAACARSSLPVKGVDRSRTRAVGGAYKG